MSPARGILAACALALVAGSLVLASDPELLVIKGQVIGENGKPVEGAEIRAMRVDTKARPVVIATTDAHGRYTLKPLPVGAYSITAYVDGFARSRATIKSLDSGWAKVDFDLRLEERGDGVSRMQ
jgi:Carboxypeptidase regulatory-like domain